MNVCMGGLWMNPVVDSMIESCRKVASTGTTMLRVLMMVAGILFVADVRPVQGQPCVPDCPESEWEPEQFIQMAAPDFPGCSLIVIYRERLACGIFRDFQIMNVYTGSTGCEVFKDSLLAWSQAGVSGDPQQTIRLTNYTKVLHDYCEQAVLVWLFNSWLRDPGTSQSERIAALCGNGGSTHWRAIRSSCVAWRHPSWCCFELVKCGDACCLRPFSVCRDESTGQTRITKLPGYVADPCPGPPADGSVYLTQADGLCVALCDDAQWPSSIPDGEDPELSSR